jgi:hypothetical protein
LYLCLARGSWSAVQLVAAPRASGRPPYSHAEEIMRAYRVSRSLAAGCIVLLLAACPADEDRIDDPALEPIPGEEMAPPPPAPTEPEEQAINVNLREVAGSGVTGTVRLEPTGVGTRVTVMLRGAEPGTHQGHIHLGTCAQPGSAVVPLEPVTVGADGSGESTTTIEQRVATLADGQHIVAYHEAGGTPGAPVACVEIR